MTETTPTYLYRGALIEYQTGEMKKPKQGFVKRLSDYIITLQNDTQIGRNAVLRNLDGDHEKSSYHNSWQEQLDAAARHGDNEVTIGGRTWHRRVVYSTGKFSFAGIPFYYNYHCGGHVGYVYGSKERVELYDTNQHAQTTLDAPPSYRNGAPKKKTADNKKSNNQQPVDKQQENNQQHTDICARARRLATRIETLAQRVETGSDARSQLTELLENVEPKHQEADQ